MVTNVLYVMKDFGDYDFGAYEVTTTLHELILIFEDYGFTTDEYEDALNRQLLDAYIPLDRFMDNFPDKEIGPNIFPQQLINDLYSLSKGTNVDFDITVNMVDNDINPIVKEVYYFNGTDWADGPTRLYNNISDEEVILDVTDNVPYIENLKENFTQ